MPGCLLRTIKANYLHLCNCSAMYVSISASLRYRLCGSGRLSLAHDHRDVEGDVKLGIQDTYIFLLYDNFFPVASIQKFVILLRSTTLVCVCVYVCVCMCAYACTYLYILMSLPRRDLVLAWHRILTG